MQKILWPLLLAALPVWASDAPSGCARLCGNWTLDATRSESADAAVDAALEKYKEPKAHKQAVMPLNPDQPLSATNTQVYLGPIAGPPTKAEMRSRLLALLAPPASLTVAANGDEILIRPPGGPERHAFPGEPHSRIDAEGTATIHTQWEKDTLVIDETYRHGYWQTDSFAPLADGTLQLTRVVDRPGVSKLRLRAVYRRG